MSSRLDKFFAEGDGVRNILGIGPGLGDAVFVDIGTGLQDFPSALIHEARKRAINLVLVVKRSGEIKFGTEEMEVTFKAATTSKASDPSKSAGAKKPINIEANDGAPAVPSEKMAKQEEVPGDALLGALGKVRRAIEKLNCSMLILLPDLDGLVLPDAVPDERARRILLLAGGLMGPNLGHPDSRLIVFSSESRQHILLSLLKENAFGAIEWPIVIPGLPDIPEIEGFLERAKSRLGLYGNPKATAQLLEHKRFSMSRISESLRAQIDNGEKDIGVLVGADYDENQVSQIRQKLKGMIGMGDLKEKLEVLVSMVRNQQDALQRGEMISAPTTHIALLGRPGTGKTAVAQLIGQLLFAAGVRRRETVITIGVKDILSEFNSGDVVKNMQKHINSAAGGVLFIDEAYGLADDEWAQGAVTTLVDEMEKRRADLTVILAGYPDRMKDLFLTNEGLRSRIPDEHVINLPDYTAEEMCQIADGMVASRGVTISEEARQRAHSIIKRETTRPHANGREVRNLIDRWDKRRHARKGKCFETDDIEDIRTYNSAHTAKIIADYEGKYFEMKEVVNWMRNTGLVAKDSLSKHKLEPAPRMLFLGPPGTGKTESARCIGGFLRTVGILRIGHLKEVSLQDFTSQYQGGAEELTRHLFEDAREGVLFIDEAYRLSADEQGRKVLDQIVHHLTSPEYASVCVIMAGYEAPMKEMLKLNQGLESRFPASNWLHFEWPSPQVLAKILLLHLDKKHSMRPQDAEREQLFEQLSVILKSKQTLSGFAGARTAITFADEIRRNALVAQRPIGFFTSMDIPKQVVIPDIEITLKSFRQQFFGQAQLENNIIDLLAEMIATEDQPRNAAQGICITGKTGTGKSKFAIWLIDMFAARQGHAAAPKILITAQVLKGQYIGAAQALTTTYFEQSRGGYLFIDEFPQLVPQGHGADQFGQSAVQQIVANMTLPQNAGTTVIVAGYPEAMQNVLAADDGLAARFQFQIEIPALTSEALAQLALLKISDASGEIESVSSATLLPLFINYFEQERLLGGESFGNCRVAENVAKKIKRNAIIRLKLKPGPVLVEDIIKALSHDT